MAPAKNPNTNYNKNKAGKNEQQEQQHEQYNKQTAIKQDLKDLNDYFQSTLVGTTTTSPAANIVNHHTSGSTNENTGNQQQQSLPNGLQAVTNHGTPIYQEVNQRFCQPSRFLPRQQDEQDQLFLTQLQRFFDEPTLRNHQRRADNFLPVNLLDLATSLAQTSSTTTVATLTTPSTNLTASNLPKSTDSNLLQRLRLIQHFLNLTSQTAPVNGFVSTASLTSSTHTSNNQKLASLLTTRNSSHIMDREVVVNSASLEDVALSEMSDNRAQSIQSLHSATETPTPDTTPSYDELQQRLENSNRNIQNMQEQQQQLMRLQNAAKQHLSEMEQLRQNTAGLSFRTGPQNGNDVPQYETIDQVHSDMASLVGRMKNLTTFIQGQNELSNLLGDDGPEILAEQEMLQRKLESLRTQRDEMRSLVDELQDINRSAEQSAREPRKEEKMGNTAVEQEEETPKAAGSERVVPIEYARVVPIELKQATTAENSNSKMNGIPDDAEQAETALLIQQKTADIETMKTQLKRLKDMMETVNLIEARTARDPKDIGRDSPHNVRSTSSTTTSSFDRENTPTGTVISNDQSENEEFISRKVRMLNEVTSDLRAQAESLQAERDRIKSLKDEIIRRKAQAAAAAQLGEDALKRSSLTPTPTPRTRQQEQPSDDELLRDDRDQLKTEYEAKKKEFERLCQCLQNDEEETKSLPRRPTARQDLPSEADDEAEEELNSAAYNSAKRYAAAQSRFAKPQPTHVSPSVSNSSSALQLRCAKEALDATVATANALAASTLNSANSTLEGTALEAGSVQSGSSHTFSLPPPMASWPVMAPQMQSPWNPNFYYGVNAAPPPASMTTSLPAAPHAPGGPFTPLNFTTLHGATTSTPSTTAGSNNDCVCSSTNSNMTVNGAGTSVSMTPAAANSTAAQMASDPVLLQQFVQTQQMLINSVCQCNQMLWHQQREIDALNNTIHILQDRLLSLAGPPTSELSFNLRAESVPPPSMVGALPNNLYAGINRAQSEQPTAFLPPPLGGVHRGAFTNYQQQQQQQFQQRQRGLITAGTSGGYNYSAETQQQNASSTNTSIYGALNNAAPQPAPVHQFNNEAPQSPMTGNSTGPGPIFMHHHNNSIHQNNANLRTQNHHANNLQQHSNLLSSGALNNQVPPGNRANNYWDNFRSYSRQNLLSTNSSKSNEEQQQNIQQQQQLQHQQQQQQQHEVAGQYQPPPTRATGTLRNPPQPLYRPPTREFPGNQTWHENDLVDLYHQYNALDNDLLSTAYGGSHSSATLSNIRNMNVNFGNSPHYQRNKVPAKPTCRPTINTPTATVTTLNRNQAQRPTHVANLDEAFGLHRQLLPAQPGFRNTSFAQNRARFDVLPTNPSQATSATPSIRDFESDFLLQTVDLSDVYNYGASTSLDPADNGGDNFDMDEDDDDTTSEEIKRNLLVNALKSDKFYESIKEDVFRRLETMLLEKECATESRQQQQPEHFQTQFCNNVSERRPPTDGGSDTLRDPLHKLHLNARNGNQQELQLRSYFSRAAPMKQLELEIDEQEENNNADTESNNADNETITLENLHDECVENEKPEDDNDNDEYHNMATIGGGDCNGEMSLGATNWRQNILSSVQQLEHLSYNRNVTHRKRKNQQDNINDLNNGELAAGGTDNEVTLSTTNNTQTIPTSPNYDLISYIIDHIKNQTNANTHISDQRLVEIAKLTATAAQSSAASKLAAATTSTTTSPPNISPKKIYAKIKKLGVSRQRDEFLEWYQGYLETLFFVETCNGDMKHEKLQREHRELPQRRALKSNISRSSTENSEADVKVANNSSNRAQTSKAHQPAVTSGSNIIADISNLPINDDDLAEADQVSANSSINTSNHLQAEDDMVPATTNQTNDLETCKDEEFVNNENPDEESCAGACALSAVETVVAPTVDCTEPGLYEKQQQEREQPQHDPNQGDLSVELQREFVKRNSLA